MKRIIFCIAATFFLLSCENAREAVNAPKVPAEYDTLFTEVQRRVFNYFWEGAEPVSGLARERFHVDGVYPQNDKHIITSGGSGFGVMAILVGIERGFITREQAVERFEKILNFLEKADSFHGAWPHWWNGETGEVKAFSRYDDGGDLVETSFLIQGLLCVRQYFREGNEREKNISERINQLWQKVDWNFYTRGENVLYWHWSPQHAWRMNFPVTGYNECLIMYVLAASSPTHPISPAAYHEGWAKNGAIMGESTQYGYTLKLKHNGAETYGGPLFWAHYSYLGLDPRGLKDKYADYWEHNKNHTLINRAWCLQNPNGYKGYGEGSWGLTASYSVKGYSAHMPGEGKDLGVISPTAALSSMPYTPEYSLQAMKHWYDTYGDKLFGIYGFYDAFSETDDWFPQRYLAIDQGPIVVMMENYRTGLLWNLFMSAPEVKEGLIKLGFQSPSIN